MNYDITLDWREYKTIFNGHEISMEIRPLKRWANALLTPIYIEAAKKPIKKDDKKKKTLTQDDIEFAYKMQELGEKIFPEHVRNIKGITIDNREMQADDLSSESVFSFLAMNILSEIANITKLNRDEVKN